MIGSDLERSVFRAVVRFCSDRNNALARKIIARLQRIKATRIYGDDYPYRTLWDEYCHEKQHGPIDELEQKWRLTIAPIIQQVVEELPESEGVLLTIAAAVDFDGDDSIATSGAVYFDHIRRTVISALDRIAMDRDMSRFDPTLIK